MTIQSISTAVAERLASIAPEVTGKVVDHLVTKELNRRSEAVITALQEIDKLNVDLKKVKPDVVTYNDDGSVASSNWTKAKLEEKNKVQQRITKLTSAVDKALGSNDYSDLFNVAKSQQPAQE
jgi:hypothetical protein